MLTCSIPSTLARSDSSGKTFPGPGYDANVVRRQVGIVFQSFNLFPHLTVLQNVTLGPRKVLRHSRAEAESEGIRLLTRFGWASGPPTTPTSSLVGSNSGWRSFVRSP